ncbi:MAG: hypothetical protein WAW73_19645 [Rhodoferax sp.]
MSGNQSSLFGGGSRWITDPKHLNLMSVQNDKLGLKSAANAATLSDVAGFFTAIDKRGATASIAGADTWVTLCDLTAAGFLFHVISPTHTGTHTPSIRITRDGVETTITPSAVQTAYYRMVIGTLTNYLTVVGNTAASVAGDIIGPNTSNDPGFTGARTGGVVQAATTVLFGIPSPEAILSMGWPALRFETSLKVEVKCSNLSATAADKQAGAIYRLDM